MASLKTDVLSALPATTSLQDTDLIPVGTGAGATLKKNDGHELEKSIARFFRSWICASRGNYGQCNCTVDSGRKIHQCSYSDVHQKRECRPASSNSENVRLADLYRNIRVGKHADYLFPQHDNRNAFRSGYIFDITV